MQTVGAEAIAANDNSQMLLGYDRHSQIRQGSTARGVPPVPGFSFVTATALNNHGDIAGYCENGAADAQAFVRLHGQVHLLGVLPGQNTSRAIALNDAGQVAGISSDEFHSRNGNSMTYGTRSSRAFFWQDDRLTDLGDREVSGLGAHGEVVGCYFPAAPLTAARQTAFLWQNGTFAGLDTFIAPSAGWQLEDAELAPAQVARHIYLVHGQSVMLDSDLAELYGVTTAALNQAVKRNGTRFPDDFMFQITAEEVQSLISQTVISNAGRGGRQKPAYVFTEQGVAMLSSVLRSERAVQVNIAVMRAFVNLRGLLTQDSDLARRILHLEEKYDRQFAAVFDAIRQMIEAPAAPEPPERRMGFRAGNKEAQEEKTL